MNTIQAFADKLFYSCIEDNQGDSSQIEEYLLEKFKKIKYVTLH